MDERQREEILQLMAKGYGYRYIGERLGLSEYRVRKVMMQIRGERAPRPEYPTEYPESKPINRDNARLVVVLFDCHLGEISPSLRAAIRFCSAHQPDEIILGGDFLDLDSINHHNKGMPGLIKNPLFMDIKRGKAVLDKIQSITPKTTYIEGNHEDRARKFSAANPEAFDGIIDVPKLLDLGARGVSWLPYGKIYSVGAASITHGWWCNLHHAKKHVEAMGGANSVFYGHTHTLQVYTTMRIADSQPIMGASCGCLCDLNPSYLRNSPNKWVNAFLILEVRDNGTFTPYIPPIINGGFTFAGKDYFA